MWVNTTTAYFSPLRACRLCRWLQAKPAANPKAATNDESPSPPWVFGPEDFATKRPKQNPLWWAIGLLHRGVTREARNTNIIDINLRLLVVIMASHGISILMTLPPLQLNNAQQVFPKSSKSLFGTFFVGNDKSPGSKI